ncbi:MAG: methyltransferase domain-containing protein [Planctomycetes bacterium]|nr:methyltransferase domain-containing protein [Planctomycetota bacterium]
MTTPLAANATGVPVAANTVALWDRVWRQVPPDTKDDARLAREYRSPRWRLIVDTLQRTFGGLRGLRTIELGCGRGDLSVLLAEQGAEVTLLDRSETVLDQARRRFERLGLSAACTASDLLQPPADGDARFDVALSIGVLEHFQRDDRTLALRSHLNWLRPGGMAIVSVPNAHCVSYRAWKWHLEQRGWWPYGVEIPFSRTELQQRATDAGFAESHVHGLGFWHSIGDHWIKHLRGRGPDWAHRRSWLDDRFGLVLLLMARRSTDALGRCGSRPTEGDGVPRGA